GGWGTEQREWRWRSLDRSTARWRILGNPSVISPIYRPDFPDDVTPAFLKVKIVAEDGSGADSDQWDGYPDERDAFFRHIIEKGWDNLVVLSGDVHISIVAELSREPFADDADEPFA